MIITLHDIIILSLSFIGLFSAIFYTLTLFSPKSSKLKFDIDLNYTPLVSIIVPIWNEGSAQGERLKKTINSLLNCNYPKDKLDIIIVNDGSTDNSLILAKEYEQYGVRVFSHKISKGKTSAINKGMKYAKGEFVAGLDADSFIEKDVIIKLVQCFKNPEVMGAIPSIKIYKPRTILQKIQAQEFLSAVFIRYVQSHLGAIPLAPGAFTMIRKTFIDKYGSLNPNTMVEDLEISMRIQSEHYYIENVIDANVYTSGVKTLKAFFNQRIRWFYGFMIQIKKYKHLFSPKYGNLGVFIMPISVTFIFLSIFMIFYTLIMLTINSIKYLNELYLVGFSFRNFFEFNTDLFFLNINNVTLLPFLLLLIAFLFMYYIKKRSNQKDSILFPFIIFMLTYWFLGSVCWVLAIYFYIRKKKVKWGPNYFSS